MMSPKIASSFNYPQLTSFHLASSHIYHHFTSSLLLISPHLTSLSLAISLLSSHCISPIITSSPLISSVLTSSHFVSFSPRTSSTSSHLLFFSLYLIPPHIMHNLFSSSHPFLSILPRHLLSSHPS